MSSEERIPQTSSLDRFLASDVESEEAEDFSSQMLLDDEAFERALAEEDDLIDAAVRGELDEESEERIRNFLGTLPEAGERLAFARELAAVLDREEAGEMEGKEDRGIEDDAQAGAQEVGARSGFWQRIRSFFGWSRRR